MLSDGWVAAPVGMMAAPPQRPPPLLPPTIVAPTIFNSKIEYDTSHMWGNAPESQQTDDLPAINHPDLNLKYSLSDKILGEGACSMVRLGHLGKTEVAVKITTNQLCEIVPRSCWSQLPKHLALCASKHVVKLLDSYEDDEGIYLVLERLPGTLAQVLLASPRAWSVSDARSVIKQLLEAIKHVHDCGLIHGDISPNNILAVDSTPTIKLGGFAKSVKFNQSGQAGTWLSQRYKSPEARDKKPCGQTVDIWGVGIICYLLVSGKLPFDSSPNISWSAPPSIGSNGNAKAFLSSLLQVDPQKRLTAVNALNHPWIQSDDDSTTEVTDFCSLLKSANL